jgi:NOL1/NOP2/fmu family ribosome biogenesis protein
MNEVIPLAALVASITACVAIAKFWLDRGKIEEKATSASLTALALGARLEIVTNSLTEFKVEVAREYVTGRSLDAAEKQMTDAMNGVRDEVRGLNQRLDRIIEAMLPK